MVDPQTDPVGWLLVAKKFGELHGHMEGCICAMRGDYERLARKEAPEEWRCSYANRRDIVDFTRKLARELIVVCDEADLREGLR